LLISVRIPDISVELPGVAGALPDHNVLPTNFGQTVFTRNTENENPNLPGDIVPGIDLDGMKIIILYP
jgi:hypothetical protein